MRIVFIVQGEGRGHMTQALALEEILTKAGHRITDTVIGTCDRRRIPDYFSERTSAQLHRVESPNFHFDKEDKSSNIRQTFFKNVARIPLYLKELGVIDKIVKDARADTVINFYDVLGGYYFLFYRPRVKRICIAHQYLAAHPEFPFNEDYPFQKFFFKLNNRVTSFFAHKRLALSFTDLPEKNNKLNIVPPLLRKEVLKLKPNKGDFILAYVVNKGYGYDILKWHEKNKKVKVHCFWDNFEKPDEWSPRENITFHHINDKKFITYLANCLGYVSTAGFESICEAMYLAKPIMMVPVEGQYEQLCNALDAQRVGAGIIAEEFQLGRLLSHITTRPKKVRGFKTWVRSNRNIILKEIEDFVPYKSHEEKRIFRIGEIILNNR